MMLRSGEFAQRPFLISKDPVRPVFVLRDLHVLSPAPAMAELVVQVSGAGYAASRHRPFHRKPMHDVSGPLHHAPAELSLPWQPFGHPWLDHRGPFVRASAVAFPWPPASFVGLVTVACGYKIIENYCPFATRDRKGGYGEKRGGHSARNAARGVETWGDMRVIDTQALVDNGGLRPLDALQHLAKKSEQNGQRALGWHIKTKAQKSRELAALAKLVQCAGSAELPVPG